MTQVIKRSGKRQAFSPLKIRRTLELAAKEAKLSPSLIKKLIKEVAEPLIAFIKKKKVIKAINIRKSLLARVDRRIKKVSYALRRFDIKKRRK